VSSTMFENSVIFRCRGGMNLCYKLRKYEYLGAGLHASARVLTSRNLQQ